MKSTNNLGKTLRQAREEIGLTQTELADKVNASQQSVAKWESGDTIPRSAYLRTLADGLQVPLQKLLTARNNDIHDINVQAHSLPERPVIHTVPASNREKIMNERKFGAAYEEALKPLINSGEWGARVRGGPLTWNVGYYSETFVVQFRHLVSASGLSLALRGSIPRMLWNLATLKAYIERDQPEPQRQKTYLLVITLPEGVEVDSERQAQDAHRHNNTRILTRLVAEAALLDIAVMLNRNPLETSVEMMWLESGEAVDTYEGEEE